MKVSKLEIEYNYDFLLYGLISPHKEYKVAWKLNKLLNLDLEYNTDIELNFKNNQKLQICNYIFETDYVSFRLIRNKAIYSENIQKPFLIPELKGYDYLLIVDGDEDILGRQEIREPLKNSDFFAYFDEFEASKLKSKENLIF